MFWRRRKQSDFSAEIEAHIANEAERLRREGLTAAESEKAARLQFGNIRQAEERFYESRRILWFEDLQKDLRYAIRTLRQAPVFAITVTLTLALGIGATAAIFSLTDAALIQPLPFPKAQHLVSLYERWQGDLGNLSPADYLDYRRQAKSFEELAAYRHESFNLGGQNRSERVTGAVVTPNFFTTLSVAAAIGRTLNSAQDKEGGQRAVVLSYALWKRRYAGSSQVIGQTISLNGESRVIVGVMPAYFVFPQQVELWAAARYQVPEHPLRSLVDTSLSRETHYFDIVGRLRQSATLRSAQAEMDVIGRRLKEQYKSDEEGDGPVLVPLRDDLVGSTRPAILVLLVAVALLLLIACANVANMVLARGATRQKEIAIRGSLGAGRLRLVRQLIVENFLLSLGGAALGLAGASYAVRSLEVLLPVDVLPPGGLHVDLHLVMFAAGLSVFCTILFGSFPALQTAKADLNSVLKEDGRTASTGFHTNRSRKILASAQIALAAILLTGAGLLLRSFDRLLSAPMGFSPDHVLSFQLSLPGTQYPTPLDRSLFATRLLRRIQALPGVRSAALASRLPLNPGGSRRGVDVKGRTAPPEGDLSPNYHVVSPGYFSTLRIPVLEGHVFSERDSADGPGTMVINASMARHFWPGMDPIGKYIKIGGQKDWSTVVGVVADVVEQGLDKSPGPAIYVPFAQDPWPSLAVVIRTTVDPKSLITSAIDAIHQIDKDEPVYNVGPMQEVVASSLQVRRFRTALLTSFAFLALTLAAVGIYGVMAYSVTQREQELGIRMALGAQPDALQLFIVGEGMQLAVYGILTGGLASIGLTRFLSGVLYGVQPTDVPSFCISFLVLLITALLATSIPARRATRFDVASVLRSQ